ncbi:MAG: hypothetical protein LBB88_02745 [Planctomycetaceae bacterium]|nr:hypothetical protein [Planctomycetaceae bacterium]
MNGYIIFYVEDAICYHAHKITSSGVEKRCRVSSQEILLLRKTLLLMESLKTRFFINHREHRVHRENIFKN